MKLIAKAALVSAFFAATPASAAVLVNGLPTGPLIGASWSNSSASQNFLVKFTLATASQVTGFQILEGSSFPSLGQALRIKIRNNVAGSPAPTNAYSFVDQVDAIAAYATGVSQVTTNFAPVALAAGTYWFGVSGEGNTQTWASYNNGGSSVQSNQRQLSGDTISSTPGIYSLAYTVLGTPSAVPEPAAWGMMVLGFGLMGGTMRRRTAKVSYA